MDPASQEAAGSLSSVSLTSVGSAAAFTVLGAVLLSTLVLAVVYQSRVRGGGGGIWARLFWVDGKGLEAEQRVEQRCVVTPDSAVVSQPKAREEGRGALDLTVSCGWEGIRSSGRIR